VVFNNILVPYDGSKYSHHAFKVALDMAQKYDSKLTILACLLKPVYRGVWYYDSRYTKAILKKEEKIAKQNISKLVEDTKKKTDMNINFRIIPTTSIPNKIIAFARTNKMDLIVMGSHGRTGFNKVLLGSVANNVSQQARTPVLLVK
jgi:nucleotide-binding universal stress UspA family protein